MTANQPIRAIGKLLLFGAVELPCAFASIWFGYDMYNVSNWDGWTRQSAIFWTFQMAIVTTILVSFAIVIAVYAFSELEGKRGALLDFFVIGVTLVSYTALNVLWRNSWDGDLSKPAFLPLWNDVNAHFFYEWNWLSYLLFVTPLIALVSTLLSFFVFRNERANTPLTAT